MLILSLQATSKEMIHLKVEELREGILKVAALAAVAEVIQLPGIAGNLELDPNLVEQEIKKYCEQLGLDEESLKRYTERTSTISPLLQTLADHFLGHKAIDVGVL